jgi:hypothetical protein
MGLDQGDQIWLIFDFWAIVFFGQFYEKYKTGSHAWATFSTVKVVH